MTALICVLIVTSLCAQSATLSAQNSNFVYLINFFAVFTQLITLSAL